MTANTIIKKLTTEDCRPELTATFNRYQKIERCWRKLDGKWTLIDHPHTAQWDSKKKLDIVQGFIQCIQSGGVVFGAFIDGEFIGFASMPGKLFGSHNDYIQLDMLHITFEHRNKGIGTALFQKIAEEATRFGAKKLYISANSSEATMAFYKAMGCHEAAEIDPELFKKEPVDCHLEYLL